ncbi:MAG: GNAT family N-acetyltransferase [Opitutales bacterium]|jgi:GNAT superfamily N-acetyltransferase|nr:GNAT family N-acetyltransferase [Opitutales bacterium]MBT5816629.1 GNAT family N-acetyltransferase [Opitutales bacterium]
MRDRSYSIVTARLGSRLVGLGNAISDSHLVVYYPHMLVRLAYGGRGIGRGMMKLMQAKYEGFHQRMITADRAAIGFYEKLGFERAVKT